MNRNRIAVTVSILGVLAHGAFAQPVKGPASPDNPLIRTLSPPGSFWIHRVAFSSDGKWLVVNREGMHSEHDSIFVAGSGARLELLDKLEPKGHTGVTISPDSKLCALRSFPPKGESHIKVYALPDFTVVRTLRDVDISSASIFWMPDSRSLLAQKQGKLSIWSVDSGEMTSAFDVGAGVTVKTISRDGKYIALAADAPQGGGAHSLGYRVVIVPVGGPTRQKSFVAHKEWIANLAFSPDSTILASAGADKMVKLWSVEDGKLIRTLEGHDWVVKAVRFTRDGKTLISVCIDETIRFWDAATGKETGSQRVPDFAITCLDLSPDESTIALGSENGKVSIFDYQALKARAERPGDFPPLPSDKPATVTAATPGAPAPAAATAVSAGVWSGDWTEFAKLVSSEQDPDEYFVGKKVTWSGKVTAVKAAEKAGDSGTISLDMKSERVRRLNQTFKLEKLTLHPAQEEWDSWKNVSTGDTVTFTTTLSSDFAGKRKVVLLAQGVGSHTGKNFAIVFSTGGMCLRVHPRARR